MNNKKYLLIDNPDYLDYFVSRLKDSFIPIAANFYIDSYLKAKGIPCIWILEGLSGEDTDSAVKEASLLTTEAIAWFDANNRAVYRHILGREDIDLVYASMNSLFKRFVIGCFKLMAGLKAQVEKNRIEGLYYLHGAGVRELCSNRMENTFFFPDNAVWLMLEHWHSPAKPRISLIKPDLAAGNGYGKVKGLLKKLLLGLKRRLSGRDGLSLPYSFLKKNLLILSPLYDLEFILSSRQMQEKYNIILWNPDEEPRPKFLKGQPLSAFFLNNRSGKLASQAGAFLAGFNFDNPVFKRENSIGIDLHSFLTPFVKRFFEKKLSRILYYWQAASELHRTTGIGLMLWANPPHRFPPGMVKEFFLLNKVPVFGSQHGGAYASNYQCDALFDLDLNHCDYYFSYGFNRDMIARLYPGRKRIPSVVPVGSVVLKRFSEKYHAAEFKKEKAKVIYPLGTVRDNIFMAYEYSLPYLSRLQQEVLDVLAGFKQELIILKFLPGTYSNHYLRPFIEKKYPGVFRIIDDVNFQECLRHYEAEIIIIDQQTTPLYEALITSSSLIVYNDPRFTGLTEEARPLLEKRAIVCDDIAGFLKEIRESLKNNTGPKDLKNREFLEKYCLYKGDPMKNIINAISSYGKAD